MFPEQSRAQSRIKTDPSNWRLMPLAGIYDRADEHRRLDRTFTDEIKRQRLGCSRKPEDLRDAFCNLIQSCHVAAFLPVDRR